MIARTHSQAAKVSMLKLAKQRHFDSIDSMLRTKDSTELRNWMEDYDAKEATKANKSKSSTGTLITPSSSALHALMVHRPPVKTVDLILNKLSELNTDVVPEEAKDCNGRTPLHLACAYKADASVVRRLLSGITLIMPACIQDDDNRVPLHWLFARMPTGPIQKLRGWNSKGNVENLSAIVSMLLKAYPESITIRDKDGFTPLDLARRNKFDKSIGSMLEGEAQLFGGETHSNTSEESCEDAMDDLVLRLPPPALRRVVSDLSMGDWSERIEQSVKDGLEAQLAPENPGMAILDFLFNVE